MRNPYVICLYSVILCITLSGCLHNDDDSDPNGGKKKQLSGLDERPENLTCRAPDSINIQPGDIAIEPAFPDLPNMGSIIAMRQLPGVSDTWYAVAQSGRVFQFANDSLVSQAQIFIDISSQVSCCGERGLLGMDFHPDYANNSEVFLSYTNTQGDSVVSRFVYNINQWQEEIILGVDQPASNHNGGNILFGPDGYLYIGLGDGGGSNDNQYTQLPDIGHGQDTRTLLGAMLRIDVDNGTPYSIPTGNTFSGNALCSNPGTLYNADDCPEIFAWGLRNPWRWSFDTQTGDLWAGDVGQNQREEVDIIVAGRNYGWKITEGLACRGDIAGCDKTGLTDPIVDYTHAEGCSITGGYVYRGSDAFLATALGNTYLYSDYCSTRLWGLKDNNGTWDNQQLLNMNITSVQSFAEANDGTLYILRDSGGTSGTGNNIYEVVANPPNQPPPEVASLLSESGCVDPQNPTQATADMIPYDIISPLWSDGATKQRFFALPNNTTIAVDTDGDLLFPVGSVLMKHFFINQRIVETRLLMHHVNGWGGYSYEWLYDNEGNPTDAQLLIGSLTKSIEGQNWFYPDSAQCMQCHTVSSNIALGPELQQLNRDFHYSRTGRDANQVYTLESIGLFSTPLSNAHKQLKLYALNDNSAELTPRIKSYLHSNCAHCHQPDEIDNIVSMDLRFKIALGDMNICDAPVQRDTLGLADPRIIDPLGSFAMPNSVLPLRMAADISSGVRMPPLATELVDSQAVDTIKLWIDGLNSCL